MSAAFSKLPAGGPCLALPSTSHRPATGARPQGDQDEEDDDRGDVGDDDGDEDDDVGDKDDAPHPAALQQELVLKQQLKKLILPMRNS